MQTEKPQVLDGQVPVLLLWLARTRSLCSFSKLPAFSCLQFLWSCWEGDERERKLGVCKLVFGTQMKSVANIMRISMESTKQMCFCQGQDRAKCCVCCVGGRCICCQCCSCLYLFAWTPANQSSTWREGRWIMGNCIARTCPWEVWEEVT